jgi:menaquinone-dependent protoporphyrinogen oxidase
MPRILLAYSTTDGHTLEICERIRDVLIQARTSVVLLEIKGSYTCDLTEFETIVIAASIRYGKHRPEVYRFIEMNREILDRIPSAFFSVNVVARKAGKNTAESNPYLRAFALKTNWIPKLVGVFAGKIDYQRYRYMDRQAIRFIMWLTHGPTNVNSCTDFTDWNSVDLFARKISTLGSA